MSDDQGEHFTKDAMREAIDRWIEFVGIPDGVQFNWGDVSCIYSVFGVPSDMIFQPKAPISFGWSPSRIEIDNTSRMFKVEPVFVKDHNGNIVIREVSLIPSTHRVFESLIKEFGMINNTGKIKNGTKVTWTSQAGSYTKEKTGVVLSFVPPSESVRRILMEAGMYDLWNGEGDWSQNPRYLVIVEPVHKKTGKALKKRYYTPLASLLEKQNQHLLD